MGVIKIAAPKSLAHIAYPGQGSVIVLDPDIPPERKLISLQLSGKADPNWQWKMDGNLVANANHQVLLRPQPGKHRLTLSGSNGKLIESVDFEIRAMKARRLSLIHI